MRFTRDDKARILQAVEEELDEAPQTQHGRLEVHVELNFAERLSSIICTTARRRHLQGVETY